MFGDLIQELIEVDSRGIKLEEVISAADIRRMKDEIASPKIRPCDFDVTIPGWLARIELRGKITIHHKDPENFRGKRKVTRGQFLSRISDESLRKMFGKWTIQEKGLTKCVFQRDYIGIDGKHYKEQFIVSVKLKPELR